MVATPLSYSALDSSGASYSGAVTVPSDATFAVVFCWSWTNSTDRRLTSVTLGTGGSQVTFSSNTSLYNVLAGGFHSMSVWSADVSSLAGGSETLAASRSGTIGDGASLFIVWVKDQAATTPVRDSDAQSRVNESDDATVTIDSTTTDLVVAFGGAYSVNPVIPSGFTQLGAQRNYNGNYQSIYYRTGLATSTTVTQTANGWPGVLAISIKESAAAGFTVTPADLAFTLTEDAGTVAQATFAVSPTDLAFGLTEDAGTVAQVTFSASPADLAFSLTADATTVEENYILAPADLGLGLTADASTVAQTTFAVDPVDLALDLTADAATILQATFELTPVDLAFALAMDVSAVSQGTATLSPADLAFSFTADASAVTQSVYTVAPVDLALALTADASTIAQTSYGVAPSGLLFDLTEDAGAVNQATSAVAPEDLAFGLTSDTSSVAQVTFGIAPADLQFDLSEDAGEVVDEAIIAVSPDDLSFGLSLDAVTASQITFDLSPADLTLALTADATTVDSNVVVSPADLAFGLTEDASAVAEDYELSPADLAFGLSADGSVVAQGTFGVSPDDMFFSLLEDTTSLGGVALVPDDLAFGLTIDVGVASIPRETFPSFPGVDQSYPHKSLDGLTQRLRLVAAATNRLNQGKMNVVRPVTLTPSATSTSVQDNRLSPFSGVQFDPKTANAAAELAAGTLYVASANRRKGEWTITHANNSQTDRDFNMVILA